MTDNFISLDATELARPIRTHSVSPVEVIPNYLNRINAVNPRINAIVTLADNVIESASRAETAVMRGELWGPPHGVPFAVRDILDTSGVRTTRGSMLFQSHVLQTDAVSVARMKTAGAILLGKTNLPEFAVTWDCENIVFGRTDNPWRPGFTPGGSTSGEVAAIAARLSPIGLGTDFGGSIRVPAHFCSVAGFKPTRGSVPTICQWTRKYRIRSYKSLRCSRMRGVLLII